jgi:uncharacterized protein UPF0158
VRKQVAIDLELVQVAFEDRNGDGQWFLDTENGDAVRVNEDEEELREQIEDGFGVRFIPIPYQGPGAGYRDMEEFAGSVTDDQLRALLEVAVRGKGAFRRFKDVLVERPSERERWFAFHNERVHDRIRRWLDGEGIEPVPRRQPSLG